MTLIIGIISEEGVVVASDGAATFGSMGNTTITQRTKKLQIIDDKIIVGVSGPVGLGQRMTDEIDKMWDVNALSGKDPIESMVLISNNLRKHIIPEIQVARETQPAIGNMALQSALSSTLVALPIQHNISLFQFDHQGAPEAATSTLPFVSIGSGQASADPFLGFIRRVFWKDGACPSLNDAVFAAIWTLKQCIDTSTGGVSYPIQVATLTKNSRGETATFYEDADLDEHKQAIDEFEKKLGELAKDIFSEDKAQPIPEIDIPKE
jgi:20S proteasome alpha/beta subunit